MSRQTTRRTGPERREQIALATLRIIGREGLSGLTTAALASEVDLTSGALFRHFESRDAILAEAVRLAEVLIEGTFPDGSLPALERLRRLAHARVKLLTKEPAIAWLLRSSQATAALPPPAVRRLRKLVKRSRAYIREALAEAVATGEIRGDVSLDGILIIFTSTVHALVGQPGVRGEGRRATGSATPVDELLTLLTPSKTPKTRS